MIVELLSPSGAVEAPAPTENPVPVSSVISTTLAKSVTSLPVIFVSPPKEVIGAFKDVASAKEDKDRMINQAEGYRNDVIPKARGEAEAMIRDAEGFKESRVKRAEGDATKFTTILKEYRKAKSITEKRLYLETMEKVLPDIEKIIVPDKDSGNMLNLLNLNTGKTAGGKK